MEIAAETFALDQGCRVCRVLELLESAAVDEETMLGFFLDYSTLCKKAQAAPLCASALFVVSLELALLIEKHFAPGITARGLFVNRTVTPGDVQKHFFLHCCFRTCPDSAEKIAYSDFSYLLQTAVKTAMNFRRGARGREAQLCCWKSTAAAVDCSNAPNKALPQRRRPALCLTRAAEQNASFQEELPGHRWWPYADLALYLLAGTAGLSPETDAAGSSDLETIKVLRDETAERVWASYSREDVWKPYQVFFENCRPSRESGPLLLTLFRHAETRNKTAAECPLCNLLIVYPYWRAMRAFKEDLMTRSRNNVGLFECLEPVMRYWRETERFRKVTGTDDENRFLGILSTLAPEVLYKHFFCDPICALNAERTNPRDLFLNLDMCPAVLELEKAGDASLNRFEPRLCDGVWAAAFAFKHFQLFPPKACMVNQLIKDSNAHFKQHNLALVSLEHTFARYV
ncbi:DNA cleavage/packaging protein [Hawaiian green turtle herpesvirus]|uniref:Packaging protein UL32 n=1 Tax=Hawaiian green turtle herpesvirus TaxID=70564 RepID=Q5ZR65_9ALPH|nr:DNA cleavage/packaging protein [Hawaiian green turtle herpesvirus]AAU93330.1 DNA cleavage/packaging protein [Hawaiian green turtle herpesvirus]